MFSNVIALQIWRNKRQDKSGLAQKYANNLRNKWRIRAEKTHFGRNKWRNLQDVQRRSFERYSRYSALAQKVHLVGQQIKWIELASYSSRQQRTTPIGGFVGSATFAGALEELRELLVWGELVHVGKNAVKGDGSYRILPAESVA